MEDSAELGARIEEARKQILTDYGRTLEKVQKLKNLMNRLELETKRSQSVKALDLATDRLNRLTDSQIMQSKKAWERYRKLEQECRQSALYMVQLDDLKDVCKKTEELAADLLCYSLARFKQSERNS